MNDSFTTNNCYEKCENYYYFNDSNNYICIQDCPNNYKIVEEKNKCIDDCENDNIYKYNYKNICYEKCPNNTYPLFNNNYICFDPIPEGFYLDTNDNIFKKCYETCKYCYSEGNETNNNCKECISNYTLINELNNYNCHHEFEDYYDSTVETEVTNLEISSEIVVISTNTMNKFDFNYSNYTSEEINKKLYEEITQNLLKKLNIENMKNQVIEGINNYSYLLTTLDSEDDNSTNKFSKINLGECENILKEYYNLDKNISLIILILEKQTTKSSERDLQFEVYEPYNKTKLSLSVCENTPIEISTPLILAEEIQNLYEELKNQGYNMFDINDDFYQDICSTYKSENNTDVPLSDRIKYYFNNDEVQCQSGCTFLDYSIETQKLKCECSVSSTEMDIENKKDKKNEGAKSLYESFYDVLKYSNYKVLKCYNLVFSSENFGKNIGRIIVFIYFGIYLVFLILYIIKGISEIKQSFSKLIIDKKQNEINEKEKIKEINIIQFPIPSNKKVEKIEDNNNMEKIENNINKNINISKDNKNEEKPQLIKPSNNIDINKNMINKTQNSNTIISNKNIIKSEKKLSLRRNITNKTNNIKIYEFPPKKKLNLRNRQHVDQLLIYNKNNNKNSNEMNKLSSDTFKGEKDIKICNNFDKLSLNLSIDTINKKEEQEANKENKEIKEKKYDNFELNNMEYLKALKVDKREFIDIYWSILKREHIIIFSFFIRNDHNILYLKFARLIFSICTDMALNVFFFSDETMHKMFVDYGKYNFIQQIPQIIYSSIVTQLIDVILCYLSLTDKYYYQLKNMPHIKKSDLFRILRCIKIKIIFFYAFTFILFVFYWYIVSGFCAVYENTQSAFIKDSFISFLIGLAIPFGLYIFPTSFRIISLRYCSGKLKLIYKLSDMIPIF